MGEGAKGGRMAPRVSLGRSPSPLAQPPPSLEEGLMPPPFPYIKEAPGEEERTQQS